MRERALAYLLGDPVFHMDMIEPIRRGTAQLLAADAQGVLLLETASRAYMLSAADAAESARLVDMAPAPGLFAAHQAHGAAAVAARFGLPERMRCHQAVWLSGEEVAGPQIDLAIRPLEAAHAEEVAALYSHDAQPGYIAGRIAAGEMIGAFDGETLAGFIGLHEEGAMGMLEVAPAYRRRSLGSALVASLSGRLLAAGRVPFSQFVVGNEASRLLHARLGFAISEQALTWLWA